MKNTNGHSEEVYGFIREKHRDGTPTWCVKMGGCTFLFCFFSSSGTALNHAERPVITWEPVLGLALYFVVLEIRGI